MKSWSASASSHTACTGCCASPSGKSALGPALYGALILYIVFKVFLGGYGLRDQRIVFVIAGLAFLRVVLDDSPG